MEFSVKESDRFNKKIFRCSSETIKASDLKKEIIKNEVDILILRMPTSTIDTHSNLLSLGFPFLHADTLVYYNCGLKCLDVKPLRNRTELELINEENIHELRRMIPVIFNGYRNHYYSNELFEKDKINEGYIEWAESYVGGEDKISWLVKLSGETVGFATCSFDDSKKESEGVLYGVHPDHAGKGLYSDIIRMTQSYFKDLEYNHMWVSTQVQNYAVQKVWLREGFLLKKSFETYHINSMLNTSLNKPFTFSFNVSKRDIEIFSELSGDKNGLHLSDNLAKEAGFNGRIVHGMLVQSYLSKFFGVDYPGEGTIFIKNDNVFLAPIYPDNTYHVRVNVIQKRNNGIINILAMVYDGNKTNCLLSYNTLLNRNLVSNENTI